MAVSKIWLGSEGKGHCLLYERFQAYKDIKRLYLCVGIYTHILNKYVYVLHIYMYRLYIDFDVNLYLFL